MTSARPNSTSGATVPLRAAEVAKRFGEVTALAGVALAVSPGECLGLLGPNGAGKTTLIRSVVGRVVPDAGSIALFGSPAGSSAARAALGWIPQELALYPRLTCRENLQAFGRYYGLPAASLPRAVESCLEWAALADRANERVSNLSGGMKRRLNMAAGLIHKPRLVLMDEPTVGVDPQSRLRIFEMIESLRAAGMSIIYTTHYMEEAERLCDRIAIVDHGRIIAEGTRDELVRSAFASRSEVTAHFREPGPAVAAWVKQRGGRYVEGAGQFTVQQPGEIAILLDAAVKAGFELEDLSLRKPNLESVFLHLTGRELRD